MADPEKEFPVENGEAVLGGFGAIQDALDRIIEEGASDGDRA